MPTLKIIAGPNGAGKSTHSKGLLKDLRIEAFDLDKEFYALWSQFDFDPSVEVGALSRAHELYVQRRSEALQTGGDFAFETNYHTQQVLLTLEMFKAKAYFKSFTNLVRLSAGWGYRRATPMFIGVALLLL